MSMTTEGAVRNFRKSNDHYRDREYLTADEMNTILLIAQSSGRQRDRDYALALLMYRHGLRQTEAGMLRWSSIDLEAKTVFIRRLKKSESGVHPLQEDEIEALKALKHYDLCPYVFANQKGESFLVRRANKSRLVKGKRYETKNAIEAPGIGKIIERLGERAEPELGFKIHAHMLRHACGYYLANKGYDARLIQSWLGHRNIQHTVRYTALAPHRYKSIEW
ncbi:MAG: tyrosine-type recombinase/integrase [Phormidium tanganyikae FI6-MK23]|jgi:type 1 fimbriae regulatory protein FimB/type 1 fimbriae regulatory protein FimE|nr:tyrosine-type recombinase/integrase [Phormidium tanganyikae FI6-MK23]